jgi:epoxyqueuosine reductase
MHYLEESRSRERRGDPLRILPECKSILVLGTPYSDPKASPASARRVEGGAIAGRVAAYAWGKDYHLVFPQRLRALVAFIEEQVGRPISSRHYSDTGPILERDLAQRAGLGWIGKNTCLINQKRGSYFLLSEVLLDLALEPDRPLTTDHCGKCTRCIDTCPTDCILPDRTLDAGRCISFLTIELKEGIPPEMRAATGDWLFGCDICQMVCPWNRFAAAEGDAAFRAGAAARDAIRRELADEVLLTPADFSRRFRDSAIKRSKAAGYRRNAIVALGNEGGPESLKALNRAANDPEPMIREHAAWAISQIQRRAEQHE